MLFTLKEFVLCRKRSVCNSRTIQKLHKNELQQL
ncbi:hypothetical protein T12_12482 [Trichinella patagoniensis]|uniref:Uncharacterized protein n=1 Tax=Trichinella patagoniensis TaxID=990121 RepID=A0A0V0YR95_9BILA|nr:hypothetical protein T12_12482 [Trichinella patagoniensis]